MAISYHEPLLDIIVQRLLATGQPQKIILFGARARASHK